MSTSLPAVQHPAQAATQGPGPGPLSDDQALPSGQRQDGQCGGCPHKAHRGTCRGKATSGCVPFGGPGQMSGFICSRGRPKPPCPCAWRECKCGASVAQTTLLSDPGIEVPVLRGSAGDPAGLLEVWTDAAGDLWCRELAPGELVTEGRWRGVEHDGPCQPLWGKT